MERIGNKRGKEEKKKGDRKRKEKETRAELSMKYKHEPCTGSEQSTVLCTRDLNAFHN